MGRSERAALRVGGMEIPVIESDRLLLRAHRSADFGAYAAMRADPEVMRHIADGAALSEEDAWSGFLKIAGLWQMAGFGSWAVEEKATGALIGSVGFQDRKRDRGAGLNGVPETGWLLARAAWGKGYATEALSAVLSWGRAHFGPVRVIALATHANTASIRVAEKCGFRQIGLIISAGRPRLLLDRIL